MPSRSVAPGFLENVERPRHESLGQAGAADDLKTQRPGQDRLRIRGEVSELRREPGEDLIRKSGGPKIDPAADDGERVAVDADGFEGLDDVVRIRAQRGVQPDQASLELRFIETMVEGLGVFHLQRDRDTLTAPVRSGDSDAALDGAGILVRWNADADPERLDGAGRNADLPGEGLPLLVHPSAIEAGEAVPPGCREALKGDAYVAKIVLPRYQGDLEGEGFVSQYPAFKVSIRSGKQVVPAPNAGG